MSAFDHFNRKFLEDYVRACYFQKIRYKCSPGIDRINRLSFENRLPDNIAIISRKVLSGSYHFTPYMERLIIKGRDKPPRVISIPTIRDKVILRILQEIISDAFQPDITHRLVQTIISEVKQVINSGKYNHFIKLDINNFYGSLDHQILFKKIRKRIRKKELYDLLIKAVRTPTLAPIHTSDRKLNNQGVPQGLSISNILASVYIYELDQKWIRRKNCHYFRFVDDILILCSERDYEKIYDRLVNHLSKRLKLTISRDKTIHNSITSSFSYLGYSVEGGRFSVRESSVHKFRESIIKLFTQYKYSSKRNLDLLLWKLNLKITGCKFKKEKYGWLFFFSQIDDLQLLYHLDWFVRKQIRQIITDVDCSKIKRFVRTFYEINYNMRNSRYIPDFSNYSLQDKKELLSRVFWQDIANLNDEEIDHYFYKVVYQSLTDLEKDMQSIS